MAVLMGTNWFKNVKYFVTFEEITKADLDSYFDRINKEKYTGRGLEWCTAQLGHFWIELRIKNPNTKVSIVEKNEHVKKLTNKSVSSKQSELERQESEENRLVDENEDIIEKISEKRSEISGLSDRF